MSVATQGRDYKSPLRKLVRFFESSRDKWKAKHHQLKVEAKRQGNAKAALQRSRDHWKEQTKQLQKQLRDLQHERDSLSHQLQQK